MNASIKIYKVENGWFIEESANLGERIKQHVAEDGSTLIEIIASWAEQNDPHKTNEKERVDWVDTDLRL